MTAKKSTLRIGQEGIDRETARSLSDAQLAEAIENAGDDVAEASADVAAALRGDRPLTDDDLDRLSDGANALLAYWYGAVQRVPEEHQHLNKD